MGEKEAALQQEIAELLRRAEQVDRDEDAQHGAARRGDELPAELARRESRLQKIREAKAALEAEAREQAARAGKDPTQAQPAPKAQRNFTDPESKIQKTADGFIQGYNAQAAVDATAQVIVAHDVTPMAADVGQLLPLVTAVRRTLPAAAAAGAGGCGVLLGRESAGPRGTGDRRVHRDRPAEARRAAGPRPARSAARTGLTRRARMARTLRTKIGPRGLRVSESDRRARVRPDQTRPWLPTVSPARADGGPARVGAALHGAQHPEAAHGQSRPMSAAPAPPGGARGPGRARGWSPAWLHRVRPGPSVRLAHLPKSSAVRPVVTRTDS